MMKRKSIFSLGIALIGVVAYGWLSAGSQKPLSDLELANIEALSGSETGTGKKCYKSITEKEGSKILFCGSCDYIDDATDTWYSGTSTC